MTKTGVTHTDTASGKGGGQLTENATPDNPKAKKPAPSSGQMHAQADHKEQAGGKSPKGSAPRG